MPIPSFARRDSWLTWQIARLRSQFCIWCTGVLRVIAVRHCGKYVRRWNDADEYFHCHVVYRMWLFLLTRSFEMITVVYKCYHMFPPKKIHCFSLNPGRVIVDPLLSVPQCIQTLHLSESQFQLIDKSTYNIFFPLLQLSEWILIQSLRYLRIYLYCIFNCQMNLADTSYCNVAWNSLLKTHSLPMTHIVMHNAPRKTIHKK